MNLDALQEIEKEMMKLVVQRRSLGGYNSEAESVLLISEVLYKLVQHLIEMKKAARKPTK